MISRVLEHASPLELLLLLANGWTLAVHPAALRSNPRQRRSSYLYFSSEPSVGLEREQRFFRAGLSCVRAPDVDAYTARKDVRKPAHRSSRVSKHS